jgi:peptidoglycan/xylan/chitin deacetylase (PgdA/CDA1 family)
MILALFSCSKATPAEQSSTVVSLKNTKSNHHVSAFVYHRFNDNRFPSTNISTSDFESQLKWLIENQYALTTFSDAHAFIQNGTEEKNMVTLTIDDAYKSFYQHAYPILKKYKITATLYVNTETVGSHDYMTWEQLKDVASYGIEIGNHTHSHAFFLNLPKETRYEAFRKEIEKSQRLIQQHLSITPKTFSYPYGEFDAEMKQIVKDAGFTNAAAQNSGVMHGGSDPFSYPRFPMAEAYAAMPEFKQKVKAKGLPITSLSTTSPLLVNNNNPPTLTIAFKQNNINTASLQCFVQGSACHIISNKTVDSITTITVLATEPLGKRRRTLYTITAPDKKGSWYWFSFVWINPSKKE